jgi:biopolymer transport protein TolR
MKCLLSVSLATLAVVANLVLSNFAQFPELQKGVSVQMAVTTHAAAYTAADKADAWIVAVTRDGSLFLGVDRVTPEGLADWIKTHPRNREANLYIKADARAQFASVKAALGPARSSNFGEAVLLTSQNETHTPGTVVPPTGIEVLLGAPSGGAIQVRLSSPAQGSALTVNNRRITPPELESTLKSLMHSGAQVVQVEANDAVPFGEIMRVVDDARATGATVALPIFHSL